MEVRSARPGGDFSNAPRRRGGPIARNQAVPWQGHACYTPAMRKSLVFMRNALVVLGVIGLVAFLVLARPGGLSGDDGRTRIQLWHPWGGPMLEAYQRNIDAFNAARDDMAVRGLYVPNDMSSNQKFFTAVIGNCAPDVIFVDGPQVAEWAERGLLVPLDDLLREAGHDVEQLRGEFYDPCWDQCVYRGKVWALTFCADPNFCFFWNKKAIRSGIAAGDIDPAVVDPERPPATVAELDAWNRAVTKARQTSTGPQLERLGLVPWGVYGNANSIFTWGVAFGGSFYQDDPRSPRVTADDPRNVAALDWMAQYARQYGYGRISSLQSSFGSAEQNPFILGKQVIQLGHLSMIADLEQYAPDLEVGMSPIPQGPGGQPNPAWVGGWALAIPAGVTDPARRRAALDFILWSCASNEGTSLEVRTSRNLPAWRPSPFFAEVRARQDEPRMRRLVPFLDILETSRYQRPVMPAQARYMDELSRAVDRVIRGDTNPATGRPWTAEEALREATQRTQRHLDLMLERSGGRR